MARGTSFVGRDDAMANLLDLLDVSRLVTVTGPGGVGKTRLVEEVAPALQARYGSAYRAFTLSAAPRDSDAAELSQACGAESPEALALGLGAGTSLLVLDNCEHVARGAADLAARVLAANEGAHIVATSRLPLTVAGERVLVVPPLGVAPWSDDLADSPAVQLFFDRASAAGASLLRDATTTATVTELCRRLDALPLAIELAAARSRALTPSELVELMDARFALLRAHDRDGADPHESLAATIAISAELLTAVQRERFQRLSVLPASFDADLAQVVIGEAAVSKVEFRAWLSELVDHSLLTADVRGTRTIFGMLESVREYGSTQLRVAGEYDDANERLVKAMLEIASDIVLRGSTEWNASLIATGVRLSDALIAAIDWCIEHDDRPDRAYMLVVPLLTSMRLGAAEGIVGVGERLLRMWPATPGALRAEALAVLSTAAATAGDYARSRSLANEALRDERCSPVGAALAYTRLAIVALIDGHGDAALEYARSGVAAAQTADLGPFVRTAQANVALALLATEAPPTHARTLAIEVADEAASAADPTSAILALVVAGTAAARADDWDTALALAERAEHIARSSAGGSWAGSNFAALHAAHRATAIAMLDGWDASLVAWNDGLDQAVERGVLHDVSVVIGFAATTAKRCGAAEAARALDAAAPASRDRFAPSPFADEPLFPARAARSIPDAHGSLASSVGIARSVFAGDRAEPSVVAVATTASAVAATGSSLVRDGDTWCLEFQGTSARVRDLKGIVSIALLLARPNTDVHCLEIMGGADVGGDAGPMIDGRARTQYQTRIRELQVDIDDAKDAHDFARADMAERELDALVEQLSDAFGLGGRDRGSGSTAQRARAAATYRIRSAVKSIGRVHPELARHLDNSIRTGVWCAYRPERPVAWTVSSA